MTMLSAAELTACRDLLTSAKTSALWVATTFRGDGNIGGAARLRRVAALLDSEIADVDKLLAAANAPPKP
jgi:hypothetical protein